MNTWSTWSAAWVTGEKLRLTFAALLSLIRATSGFGRELLQMTYFADLRRFGEAHAAIDRALEISPNDQYAITVKALLFQYEGRLDEAAKQLARLPNDSTDKTILLVRATQALLERNFEQVIFCTKQVTRSVSFDKPLSTQDTLALVLQGYGQQWTGRSDEARATFGRIIQAMAPAADAAAGATYDARSLLALAYAGIGDKEKALEQANQAVAEYDNDAVNKANRRRLPCANPGAFRRSRCSDCCRCAPASSSSRNSSGRSSLLAFLGPVAQGPALRSTRKESAAGSVLRKQGRQGTAAWAAADYVNGGRETAAPWRARNLNFSEMSSWKLGR